MSKTPKSEEFENVIWSYLVSKNVHETPEIGKELMNFILTIKTIRGNNTKINQVIKSMYDFANKKLTDKSLPTYILKYHSDYKNIILTELWEFKQPFSSMSSYYTYQSTIHNMINQNKFNKDSNGNILLPLHNDLVVTSSTFFYDSLTAMWIYDAPDNLKYIIKPVKSS